MGGALILCINLQRSPDRRAIMEAEARKAGVNVTFVQAIDGRELTLDKAPGYDRCGRLKQAPDLKPNEVACVLSHKLALEAFLESDAPAAVILEDDAVLSDRFSQFVNSMMKLPIPWNAVNLENRNRKPLRPALFKFDFGVSLHVSAWSSSGSTGRLYSREGAERVLNSLWHFRHPYDTHLGFFWRHGLSPLCSHPPVVSSRPEIPSTISQPGEKRLFEEKDLSTAQFLRARRERIEHEIRKEAGARLELLRMKAALAVAR